MRFSKYMNEWLYGKDGYYTKYITIGKEGDFYTAVSSSMFFGGSIANRFIKVFDEGYLSKKTTIVEIGAHKGYMLADIVQFIYTLRPKLLKTLCFAIIEPQEENAKKQIEYFKDCFGNKIKLEHYKDLDEVTINEAFVVANEIFDAFPCEVIKDNQMLYMDGQTPYFDDMSEDVKTLTNKYKITRGELGLGYYDFAKKMANAFKKYEFVTFDYGEMAQRRDFSIRIYHKHNTYPFFALTDFVKEEEEKPKDVSLDSLFKKSDITYDVNFSYLIGEFEKSGAKKHEFQTQLVALVEFGISELLELLARNTDQNTYEAELNRAKTLINPTFMGERFKCVIFRKNKDYDATNNKW